MVPLTEQQYLASLLGMKLGKLPMRYLGVPLISRKLKEPDCQPLVDKITSRIRSWTSKLLSFAGTLQSIDSVLNHMISYWLQVFILSKKVIKSVHRLCCAFLWKGSPDSTVGAKVSWKNVYQPKTEGGLGLKDLCVWNQAIFFRQIWFIFSESDSLWIAWVKENLLENRNFWLLRPLGMLLRTERS